ncbi:MAG: hypothetical protein PUK38_05560 [Coriobacteriaceae bacterium]|nr:hypothetical protein [Coriobacteriaceae bacterium]
MTAIAAAMTADMRSARSRGAACAGEWFVFVSLGVIGSIGVLFSALRSWRPWDMTVVRLSLPLALRCGPFGAAGTRPCGGRYW